jgi:peptidoglycan-binding protein ArfA
MPSSHETPTTEWRTASRFYRRPPGLGWLLGLLVVPLLLGVIGYHALPKAHVSAPSVGAPSVSAPSLPNATVNAPNVSAPALSFAPLSLVRTGNNITLSGDLPGAAARASLLDALKGAFGPLVNIIDKTDLKAGVNTPDPSSLGAVFKVAAPIPGFNFKLDGDTVTLAGTAASDQVKAAVGEAVKAAWPNMKIANEIQVTAPGAGGACANLAADVAGLLRRPIEFDTDSYTLSASEQQELTQVADRLKACPNANIGVSGYTDATGNDAINVPLSNNRAKAVVDFLESNGVPGNHVTARGLGAADPAASNDTTDGRAQNRRVVIVIS